MSNLRAPFPYFGYKGKVSEEVWRRLGDPPNYIEPFFGSGAVLLQRPSPGKREVVNDKHGALANFWRAVQSEPITVAKHAAYISSESDLHARNAACRAALETLTARIEGDPEYYDCKLAGWWCYVQCMAIGEAAYARGPWIQKDGLLVKANSEVGIRRAVPCDSNKGIMKSIPFHSSQGLLSRVSEAEEVMERISKRMANVRILCGDWSRACKPTYTTQHGLTGVFLDPPYEVDYKVYKHSESIQEGVCNWAASNGNNPLFRIAICGYEGTFPPILFDLGWKEFAWEATGGHSNTGGAENVNRFRERILFSPHCLSSEQDPQLSLFEEAS